MEPYHVGQQKIPLIVLSFLMFFAYFVVSSSTTHIKTHTINKRWPLDFIVIMEEHTTWNEDTWREAVRRMHPQLAKEYVFLLVGRWVYAMLYAWWGVEITMRTVARAFDTSRLPLELLPFLVAALEVIINAALIALIYNHPFTWYRFANVVGVLQLVKHTARYACIGLVLLSAALLYLRKAPLQQRKLE